MWTKCVDNSVNQHFQHCFWLSMVLYTKLNTIKVLCMSNCIASQCMVWVEGTRMPIGCHSCIKWLFLTKTLWHIQKRTHVSANISKSIKKHGIFLLIYLKHYEFPIHEVEWYKNSSVGSVSFLPLLNCTASRARSHNILEPRKKLTLPTLEILYHLSFMVVE